MTPSDHSQLYSDITHCLEVLVDTISDEILEGVNDLVLDGDIALSDFFDRHGMVDDGCDRHVFFSSYQRDIIKRVEKKVGKKGYVCRVKVIGKGRIQYTTRIPHPLRSIVSWSLFIIFPMLLTVAALQYTTYFRDNVPAARIVHEPYSRHVGSVAITSQVGWRDDFQAESRRRRRSQFADKRIPLQQVATDGNGTA